jgi:hypothetical protein
VGRRFSLADHLHHFVENIFFLASQSTTTFS